MDPRRVLFLCSVMWGRAVEPGNTLAYGLRSEDDTIGDIKKLVAAQTGTHPDKIVLKKW